MGVMNCVRKSCDNILCDTYIDDIGYICNECKKEFKEYMDKEGFTKETEIHIVSFKKHIRKFIDTEAKTFSSDEVKTVEEHFRSYER